MERKYKIYTGLGGYILFEEKLEEQLGIKRVYIGNKVPRFLRRLKTAIVKGRDGRYFKRVPFRKVSIGSGDTLQTFDSPLDFEEIKKAISNFNFGENKFGNSE